MLQTPRAAFSLHAVTLCYAWCHGAGLAMMTGMGRSKAGAHNVLKLHDSEMGRYA